MSYRPNMGLYPKYMLTEKIPRDQNVFSYLEIGKNVQMDVEYMKNCVSGNISQFHNEITLPPNKDRYSQNSRTRVLMKMCIKGTLQL